MTANHQPIQNYHFKNKPSVAITTSLAFDEQAARIWAGISYADYTALPGTRRYIDPANPSLCKCDVVALYRLTNLIEAVGADARTRK